MPCGLTASLGEEKKNQVYDVCAKIVKELNAAGIRSKADYRENYSPGWKFNDWELKVCFYLFVCFLFLCLFLVVNPGWGSFSY